MNRPIDIDVGAGSRLIGHVQPEAAPSQAFRNYTPSSQPTERSEGPAWTQLDNVRTTGISLLPQRVLAAAIVRRCARRGPFVVGTCTLMLSVATVAADDDRRGD